MLPSGAVLTIAAPLVVALGVFAVAFFAMPIGRRLGLLDRPDGERKRHRRVTPLVGGLALMLPLTAASALLAVTAGDHRRFFLMLALASASFLTLGLIDDRRHISALPRLAVSFGLGCLFVLVEPTLLVRLIDVPGYGWRVELGMLALPFTLLCLIGLQNAINMADGKNGLVISLATAWVALLSVYAPPGLQLYLVLFLVGLIVLLPFNLLGRLFLGDSGSYAVAIAIGLLATYVHGQAPDRLSAMTVTLWFLVPVLDCLRVIAARTLARRSPFAGDRNHLHHRLLDYLPLPAALAAYLGLALGPAVAALFLPEAVLPLIVLTAAIYAFVIWLTRMASAMHDAKGQGRPLVLRDRKA